MVTVPGLPAGKYRWTVRAVLPDGSLGPSATRARAAVPGAHQARGEGDSLAVRLFTAIFLLMLGVALVSTGLVGAARALRHARAADPRRTGARRRAGAAGLAEGDRRPRCAGARRAPGWRAVPGFLSLPQAEQRAHLAAVLTERRDLTALTVFSPRGERLPGLQAFAVKDLPPTEVAEHEARARALLGPGPESVRWSPATLLPGRPPSITFVFPLGRPGARLRGRRAVARRARPGARGRARGQHRLRLRGGRPSGRLLAGAAGAGARRRGRSRPSRRWPRRCRC